ncbi:MAG TPA: XkdF-like putative serine protease domain-containing protein [Polyangiaceae bacterium]|nr:XkdF-like putative serine protease domain-containing protein [Polyangiaceae bacterium]
MNSRCLDAITNARRVLAAMAAVPDEVEKTLWGSPAGKKRIAARLVRMLPAHKTYVEPFAGSAAVLFAKEPVPVEVINDADPEIAEAYRLVKGLDQKGIARLRRMPWTGDPEKFKELFESQPTDDVAKLHRFLYVTHFSYGKLRGKSFSPSGAGVEAKTIKRIEQFAPRLRNVKIYGGDYEKVVRKYDSKDTAFFLDPPYPGYNVNVGESDFDEERFFKLCKSLKGKFLITYGIRGRFPKMVKTSSFWTKRIRTPRTISTMRGVGGPKTLTQLLVANYEPTTKSLEGDVEFLDFNTEDSGHDFAKSAPLIKGLDPNDERYVLGIVLEPEVVDAQGDIYSAEEIRQAAHRFMEEFGGLGLMHRMRVNDQVKVLETYLAPTDLALGDVSVQKGTWLFAVRVLSDVLWERVKSGDLTGFSIGGSARKIPEIAQSPESATAAENQPAAPSETDNATATRAA